MRMILIASLLLAGCVTSGMKPAEMRSSMQALKPGEGRIYFYRTASFFGSGVQVDIHLNEEVVGTSMPGGFFFVDRPAGQFKAWASTEVARVVTFTLDAGETKYVRTYASMGILVGRVNLELVSAPEAEKELESLHYTGATPAEPPNPPARSGPAPSPGSS